MTAPDFIEPLVGFRAWRVDRGVLVPWSAGAAGAWEPGVNTAKCLFHPAHRAPVAACSCGLYALADAADERLRPDQEAVGAIVAWGDVEVHRTGFRAELATIVALTLPDRCSARHEEDLRMAARRYRVPLVPVDHLVETACEHGRPIPFEAIPPRPRTHRPDVPSLARVGLSGTVVDDHIEVTLTAEGVRLAPTPEVRALQPPGRGGAVAEEIAAGETRMRPAVEIGSPVRRGDVILRSGGGDDGLVLRTPLTGHVVEADQDAVFVLPSKWEEEGAEVEWGSSGRRAYAAALGDLGRHGDPFAQLRTRWWRATEGVRSAADVRMALKRERERPRFADDAEVYAELGERVRRRLARPEVRRAAQRLRVRILWRLHRPDAALLLDLEGDEPAITFDTPDAEADLVLYAAAETADDLLSGRADFATALRGRALQSPAPPADVLRAASVLKPLHERDG